MARTRKSDLRRSLSEASANAALVAREIDATLRVLADCSGVGWPSGGDGSGGVAGSRGDSIVERHAFSKDEATAAERDLIQAIQRADVLLADAARIVKEWKIAARPTDARHRTETGCEVMAEVGVYEQGHMTDVGGRLPRKMLLCRWVISYVLRHDALPGKADAEKHAQGIPVRR